MNHLNHITKIRISEQENVIPNCVMYHKILHKTTMLLSFFPLAEPEDAIDSKIASLLT